MSSPNENEKPDTEILDHMVADLLQFPIIHQVEDSNRASNSAVNAVINDQMQIFQDPTPLIPVPAIPVLPSTSNSSNSSLSLLDGNDKKEELEQQETERQELTEIVVEQSLPETNREEITQNLESTQEEKENLRQEKTEKQQEDQKEIRERNEIVIQTHSGKFHADECAAIALLSSLFASQGYNVTVVRSRDSSKFDQADILVDVGLEYDPSRHRYDHHQKSCNETWENHKQNNQQQKENKEQKEGKEKENAEIPLSSVGLIWRHFGKDVLQVYLNTDYFGEFECNDKIITDLWNTIYYKIIQDLDAHDNGIIFSPSSNKDRSNNLNIPAIISAMNTGGDENEQNVAFQKAVTLIGQIFEIKFKEIITTYFKFSQDLEKVDKLLHELNRDVDTPPDANPEHTYLILKENIPTIYKCLNKLDPLCQVVFLIFCEDETFSLKTRRRPGEAFASICDIAPEEVLREKMISEDFSHLLFLHKALFLAKFSTLEAAVSCAKVSLDYSKEMVLSRVSSPSSICNNSNVSGLLPSLPSLPSVPSVESVVSLHNSSNVSDSESVIETKEELKENEKGKEIKGVKEKELSVRDLKLDKTSVYFTAGFVALGSMFYWLTRR